jgi:type IV fimbrial biogenesis protein FimT
MEKNTQSGFTLFELMITVLVLGVVLAFGIPNFSAFTQNSRMTSTANDLHAAFQMARSEAARAKTNITICASADPLGVADCDGTWDQGFIVYVENNNPPNLARDPATEPVLRASGPIATGVSLAVADDATYFTYASTGLGRQVAGATPLSQIVMCDERGNITAAGGNSAARLFVSTPLGRATIARDKGMIGTALTTMSKACP